MSQYENSWLERVRVLTMALDSMISMDDFLAVSEAHINEDCQHGIKAIVEGDKAVLDQAAGYIRGRSLRVCEVVLNEMSQHPMNPYCENVKRTTLRLRDESWFYNKLTLKNSVVFKFCLILPNKRAQLLVN